MTDDRRRTRSGSPANRGTAASDGPMPAFDLYAVLGVHPESTHQEIVEAAAAMDRRLRTAAARERPGATARLKRVNVDRHWLTDPRRRRDYDDAVTRGEAGAAATTRVRTGRVGAGSAGRRSSGGSWLSNPLTWAGGGILIAVVAFLLLRPGAPGGGASPSAGPSGPSGAAASSAASPADSGGAKAGCPTAQPAAAPAGEERIATIETAKGAFEITLDADLSPIAVGNFEALASCGYYDGVVFHRVVPNFVFQGGDGQNAWIGALDRGTAGQGGPGYEFNDEPVVGDYTRGTVAMANSGANTNGSQFFIVVADQSGTLPKSYTIFGHVTSGMDVVDQIVAAPRGARDFPDDPVPMTTVTVAPGPPPSGSPGATAAPEVTTPAPSPGTT